MPDALDKILISLGLKEEPPSNASIALTGLGVVGSAVGLPSAVEDTLGIASRRVIGDAMTAAGPTGLSSNTFDPFVGAEIHKGDLGPALRMRQLDDPTGVNKRVYMPRGVLDEHIVDAPDMGIKHLVPGWDIPSKYIPGSEDFSRMNVVREALEALPEYARNHKRRVGFGAANTALGVAGVVGGAHTLADKLEKRSMEERVRKLWEGK